jgi:hypothetical protein
MSKLEAAAVTQLAQSDPVPAMQQRWVESVQHARKLLDGLVRELRVIDSHAETLAEHGITVTVDLGPIGNAAAAARRDLERDTGKKPFEMPR